MENFLQSITFHKIKIEKNYVNDIVINNYNRLKLSLFFPPICALIIIAIFFIQKIF